MTSGKQHEAISIISLRCNEWMKNATCHLAAALLLGTA